jgi:hypothetical protein
LTICNPKYLAELIANTRPSHSACIRNSVGLNFGTKLVTGFIRGPVDNFIREAMWQCAVDSFAFDALIQNPDRRYGNANRFTRGDSLLVFDHEMAFSFLAAVLPSPTPWKVDQQQYLRDHVFYRRLKSKPLDLTGFTASLGGLSDGLLGGIRADVPAEWNNENVVKIERHLRAVQEHRGEFAEEVRRFLV